MKCPHCLENFHDKWNSNAINKDIDGYWGYTYTTCPACKRLVIYVGRFGAVDGRTGVPDHATLAREIMVRPKAPSRAPLPPEVPEKFAGDYREACQVFADSTKASAALSRRCLQNLLRDHVGVNHGNLDGEIQQVLDSGKLPTDLTEAIDAVRVLGNFAAHPIKSTNTGEIMDVEPGEAEWQLNTLEALFDFYFVRPASLKRKRDALNAKLKDAGKPLLK